MGQLSLAAFSLGSLLLGAAAIAQSNVLIVVADDLGTDLVGCFGDPTMRPPTPTLDALAANGLVFTNAHADPVCSPSRAALMTGRYAFRTGVGDGLSPGMPGLDPGEICMP